MDLSGLKREIQDMLHDKEEILDCSYYELSDRVQVIFKSPRITRGAFILTALAIVELATFQGINKELRICGKVPSGVGVIDAIVPMPPKYDPEHPAVSEAQLKAISTQLSIASGLR